MSNWHNLLVAVIIFVALIAVLPGCGGAPQPTPTPTQLTFVEDFAVGPD